MKKLVWDIESNGLLDESTVDYTASPYRLKDTFKMHCIVVLDAESKEVYAFYDGPTILLDGRAYRQKIDGREYVLENYDPIEYTHLSLDEFPSFIESAGEGVEVIAHNQINFDLLVCKLYYGMDYTIEKDTWQNVPVKFVDTLVLSKTLNPDRFGGHSLDNLSSKTSVQKVEFRKHLPQNERFIDFAADMLYYNIYDCLSNLEVYHNLNKEAEGWKWDDAISLEKAVADIITRQSHRGFKFNKTLAEEAIKDLDNLMEERRLRVEPLLPKKKATKAFMKDYIPPKVQFKKDGTHSSNLIKWVEKHNGKFIDSHTVEVLGGTYSLPLPQEPLVTEVEATIDDSTHIKEWLVSLGWIPTEWKEKDLTVDTKKVKLSREKFEAAVERYVEQTLESPLCELRCEYLEVSPEKLRGKLLSHKIEKPLRVQTNPSFTVGQEKELCPDLERISEQFPYVKDVVEYLTYKHRRNSILGGGLEWEEGEEAEKGYLAAVREDGRIPTPADTCGAATSRMKHKIVANIPRVTSLYGEQMRSLFGVDKGFYQMGYDFDSLEAREEAHYCVPMTAKALTREGWKGFNELKVGEEVLGYNSETGKKEWTVLEGLVKYENSLTYELKWKTHQFRATGDHRWFVQQRGVGNKYQDKVLTTSQLNTGTKVIVNAPFNQEQDSISDKTDVTQGKYGMGWVQKVLNMSHAQRKAFLEGFMIADGYWHTHKQNPVWRWAQKEGELFEAALLASYLVHSGNITVADNGGSSDVKVVTLCNNSTITGQRLKVTEYGREDVWCPQTKLGSWVMRQGDCITITGNCWRYEQEPREYCNSLLLDKPNDVHTMMAKRISEIIKKAFARGPAKSVKYGCTYGAQAAKVAKTIGSDIKTGEIVFNAFWEAAKPLAELKEKLKQYWEKVGKKKFILGIDGRKVPTRSAHAILNSLFQSAGVICAKRAMVIHDRLLKEHGLSVDFFSEDWKNKEFCQQLIAYHDEAQLEVSRSLVKFKTFPLKSLGYVEYEDEEEKAKEKERCLALIQAEKDKLEADGSIWSDIKESPKGGWFIAHSLAGELAAKAVKMAGEYYNLNVSLTAGYMIGLDWKDCH